MSDNWGLEDLITQLKNNPDLARANTLTDRKIPASQDTSLPVNPGAKKPNKYRAQRTEYNGVMYDSKKEAEYAQNLDLCRKAGEIRYWLRQVPFMLPGKTVYRVDFMEVNKDGSIDWTDVKGIKTPAYRIKKRQVEALYPIKIREA